MPKAISGEFEAGILLHGRVQRRGHRRATAAHWYVNPENSDNLLLMADLMKTAERRDEAVAILQYAAEHAAWTTPLSSSPSTASST